MQSAILFYHLLVFVVIGSKAQLPQSTFPNDKGNCFANGNWCEFGVCINRHCECLAGYILNPFNPLQCVDQDECALNPYLCGSDPTTARCVNTFGSYQCDCDRSLYSTVNYGKSCLRQLKKVTRFCGKASIPQTVNGLRTCIHSAVTSFARALGLFYIGKDWDFIQ